MRDLPNYVITGPGRHGKDTASEYLRDTHHLTYRSSSMIAAEMFIFDALKDKYGYTTLEECYEDRVNHRAEWYNLIVEHNTPDRSALGRTIFENANIYCGLRNIEELKAIREAGLVDFVIWIDASNRCDPEPSTSLTIRPQDCDIVIDNNGAVENMYRTLDALMLDWL